MKKKKLIYRREFLNLEPDTIRDEAYGMAAILFDGDNLRISDCRRAITLEFWARDEASLADLDNMDYKIDTLFDVIKEYRTYIKRRNNKLRQARMEVS